MPGPGRAGRSAVKGVRNVSPMGVTGRSHEMLPRRRQVLGDIEASHPSNVIQDQVCELSLEAASSPHFKSSLISNCSNVRRRSGTTLGDTSEPKIRFTSSNIGGVTSCGMDRFASNRIRKTLSLKESRFSCETETRSCFHSIPRTRSNTARTSVMSTSSRLGGNSAQTASPRRRRCHQDTPSFRSTVRTNCSRPVVPSAARSRITSGPTGSPPGRSEAGRSSFRAWRLFARLARG